MTITDTETGSKPAPGRLALVQAFINTVDLERNRDALANPELLTRWLKRHGLLQDDDATSQTDLEHAIAFREALRALLLANNGAPLAPETVETLNAIAETSPLTVHFTESGTGALEPHRTGPSGAFAQLLATVYQAMVAGTWPRLKACQKDGCHWAFYDASKNRSGTWCAMAVCGSRLKTRAYRARQRRGDKKS